MERRLLIVDDDVDFACWLAAGFESRGYAPAVAHSAAEAIARIDAAPFEVVLTDLQMPGASGIELIAHVRQRHPGVPVVLMTAYGSEEAAVEALRAGASNYLRKPFSEEEAAIVVEKAAEWGVLRRDNQRLRQAIDETQALAGVVARSPAMREVLAVVRQVAGSRSNVLVTGESGTGKEVVARALHHCGSSEAQPFVAVSCAAFSEGVLESELFGHMRGAFTSANEARSGVFEQADEGTLFLDEIAELPSALQPKLLRAVQEREVRPVGSDRARKVDVRIIAATNRDLEEEMAAGRFREDLFYRLNVIHLHLPPLRDRSADIEPLARHFLVKHSLGTSREASSAAYAWLRSQPWRGNVRELENAVERAIAMSGEGILEPSHFDRPGCPAAPKRPDPSNTPLLDRAIEERWTLRDLEDRYTHEVIRRSATQIEAARWLGVTTRTLQRRARNPASELDPR